MPRLFVAIDPSAPVRDALARLSHGVPGAKWVAPEQFHLTLRFIGAVEGALYDEICQWRSKKGPPRRCKKGPLGGCGLVP